MKIINYKDFSALRLEDFVSKKKDIRFLVDFEFMSAIWKGNALGFTEFLYLEDDPNTRSISFDFSEHTNAEIQKFLSVLKLKLNKGTTREKVINMYGKPLKIENFVSDRESYEYIVGSKEKYYMSLTLHNEYGLIYLVLMNHAEIIREFEENTVI